MLREEDLCIEGFKKGNKEQARDHLKNIQRPSSIKLDGVNFTFGSKVTLLHCAAYHGWEDLTKELIAKHKLSPSSTDSEGRNALHYASSGGVLEVVVYLVAQHGCKPSSGNKVGLTSLHYACTNGRLDIVQYFVTELKCDPSMRTRHRGDTPLHSACEFGHADVAQFLLSTGQVDHEAKNKEGNTPLYYAQKGSNNFEIFKVFNQCGRAVKAFPVHSFTKAILTGNSTAGKSTLAEVLIRRAHRSAAEAFRDKINNPLVEKEVKTLTAGINPLQIESEIIGNIILYDFAGQPEFYSSHFAVMENAMQRSAAIFINLVDLSKTTDEIIRTVYYWMNFIENSCVKLQTKCHILMVGSHLDLLKDKAEREKKEGLLKQIAKEAIKTQRYVAYVSMDCRRVESQGVKDFVQMLFKSQREIVRDAPSMSFYCHFVYAFLQSREDIKQKIAIKLSELAAFISKEDGSLGDLNVLAEHVSSLSDRGLVMFLQKEKELHKSWVVIDKVALLKEVDGTLFSPSHFEEHRKLASNTGIILHSTLEQTFSKYNMEMLVWFLRSLEFCIPVDIKDIFTNLSATTPTAPLSGVVPEGDTLMFFPSLVQVERPENENLFKFNEKLSFGWCLTCIEPHQFFSPRFLHMLLLSIAFSYSLHKDGTVNQDISNNRLGIHIRCNVWENGISWTDTNGITSVVELIRQNKMVVIAMSSIDEASMPYSMAQAELRSNLIDLVHRLRSKHCYSVKASEFLLSPSLVESYPFDLVPDKETFKLEDLARSILRKEPFVLSTDNEGRIGTKSIGREPYVLLHPYHVKELMDEASAEKPVSGTLLENMRLERICERRDFSNLGELRKFLDKMSIFRGSNLLQLGKVDPKDILGPPGIYQQPGPQQPPPPGPQQPPPPGPQQPPPPRPQEPPPPQPRPPSPPVPGRISLAEFEKRVVPNIPNRWRDFGISLGIGLALLDSFANENHYEHKAIFSAIYKYWREYETSLRFPRTYDGVVELLRTKTMEENGLADDIMKHSKEMVSPADFTDHVVTNISSHWKKFGISLGLQPALIDAFAMQHSSEHRAIFADIYQEWEKDERNLSFPLTWGGIVDLLSTRAMDEVDLADKIKDQFCSQN